MKKTLSVWLWRIFLLGGVKTRCDLSYKNDRNLYHDFDIYYGNSSYEDLPTIIIVHGGGLVYGTKELDKNMEIYFA